MPALPRVPLCTAQIAHAVVIKLLDAIVDAGVHLAGDFGAVVAGEDDERVVGDARSLQSVQHLADRPVGLKHKVAVITRLGFTFEFRRRHDGKMGRREGQIEKERLPGLRVCLDPTHRATGQFGQDVLLLPARQHETGAVKAARAPRVPQGRNAEGAIILDKTIGRMVRHLHTEVIIKTARRRAVGDGPGQVQVVQAVRVVARRLAVLHRPIPAEVPLADAGRRVAVLLQQRGHGWTVGVDEGLRPPREHGALEARAPRVASRENRITRRRADGRRGVGIGEAHALARQAVEVRRGDLRVTVVTAEVAVAEVIGEDVDDVRARRLGGLRWHRGNRDGEEEKKGRLHEVGPAKTLARRWVSPS